MDGSGDWICGVVHRGVWKRGVVYGVGEETRVWAVCDLSNCAGDIGIVFRVQAGWVTKDLAPKVIWNRF